MQPITDVLPTGPQNGRDTVLHSQLLQEEASGPRLSNGKGGRLARKVKIELLLVLVIGTLPNAAAAQNLLEQRHLPTSARLTPDTTSAGVGSPGSNRAFREKVTRQAQRGQIPLPHDAWQCCSLAAIRAMQGTHCCTY